MEEEKRPEWNNVQPDETIKTKKKTNKFFIKYIIFVIILILITCVGIYFSIKNIDEKYNEIMTSEESDNEIDYEQEPKNIAEDSKYAINSYSETYDTNSLEIKYYYDIDGKITREDQYTGYEAKVSFIQISGLKNTDIQDRINAKLKNVPYTLEKEKSTYVYVEANFSNILSVVISNDIYNYETENFSEIKTLNFDLTTGNEIPFEKLFVSSAPIKSMIASGMYEDFAWDKSMGRSEESDSYDMKDADTSEIEEQFLLAVRKYDQIKDNIVFSFSPTSISIHNSELATTIDMAEYASEIAIYKRYLTEGTIYENDDLGTKGTIVFTEDIITKYGDDANQISYGKISDNIFVEEVLWTWDDSLQEKDMETIINYVNKLSQERKTLLKQQVPSNKGVIFQGEYNVYKDADKGYYHIMVNYHKAQCSLSYFEEGAFKDYIEMKGQPRVDVGLNVFEGYEYMQEKYPEMQISERESKEYYLSLTGEFIGNTQEEVESKVWE